MDGIEILVFIAIMGLLLYRKATKNQLKDKLPRQKRPVVAPEDEGEVMETVVQIKEPEMPRFGPLCETTLKRESIPPVSDPKKKVSTRVPSTMEGTNEKIHLKTREDARRAFLYSEIFNRKYD